MRREHLDSGFLERFERIKHHLVPFADIKGTFEHYQNSEESNALFVVKSLGSLHLNSSQISVADACIGFISDDSLPFFEEFTATQAQVNVLLEQESAEIAAVQLIFSPSTESLVYYNALSGEENLFTHFSGEGDTYFGIDVETSVLAIADRETQKRFIKWYRQLVKDHGIKEPFVYNDVIVPQATGHQLLNKSNYSYIFGFDTESSTNEVLFIHLARMQGYYPAYFGFDSKGKVCELLLQFSELPKLH